MSYGSKPLYFRKQLECCTVIVFASYLDRSDRHVCFCDNARW